MKKEITLLLLFLTSGFISFAQQEAHYTQYMYNMSIVNPAYMINKPGLIEVGSLYRMQWTGIDGAPRTANVFANIPLSENLEISANFLNDHIGESSTINFNTFNTDIAYKVRLNENLNLSAGLKIGFDSFNLNFSDQLLTDPSFENKKDAKFKIGAGLFLFAEQFYVGLSAPNFSGSKIEVEYNDQSVYSSKTHFFLMGGYIFKAGDNFKIKPSTIVKQTSGAPLTFDLSLNTLFADRFELGASYRYQESVAFLTSIFVTRDLRLGYAYDLNTGNLKEYTGGSHEFLLTYTFDVVGLGKKYASPRFY